MKKTNNIEVRLAAIDAMRRMPCQVGNAPAGSHPLIRVVTDKSNNPELRMAALLQMANCPDHMIPDIVFAYDKETDQQVGSFMYHLITTRSKTADPSKSGSKHTFQKIAMRMRKKFRADPRKYSSVMEVGKFDRKMNVGAQIEKGTMFTDGKVPTNFYANLTVQLFGQSINLLEVGGRQEGLGDLMEDLFGPEGYYTNPEAWEFGERKGGQKQTKTLLSLRGYLRVFGDEVHYGGIDQNNPMKYFQDKVVNMEEIWKKLAQ
jgi:hypothetical protein